MNPATDVIGHDFYLTKGWYRADTLTIPTDQPPGIYSCGTQVPIWMKGTNPVVQDGIVDRIACRPGNDDWCEKEYEIKVKNCNGYFVYNLGPTDTRNEGYCFGIGTDEPPPDYVASKPSVTARLVEFVGILGSYTRAHFVCDFAPSVDDETLFYEVTWIITGMIEKELKFLTSRYQVENINEFEITEEKFINEYQLRMGIYIACTVRAFALSDSVPGQSSPKSNGFFAGILVNISNPVIERGEERLVTLQPTVPIGCIGDVCSLTVQSYVPAAQCSNAPTFNTFCGVAIQSNEWNAPHEAKLTVPDTIEYDVGGTFEIHFQIVDVTLNDPIWKNYTLPPVTVEVVDSVVTTWKGRKCSSVNDPHMRTFDGRPFENHHKGAYILYRHKSYDTEVQIKVDACYRSTIMCNCGVAVKAGQEVYVIDRCGPNTPYFNFKSPRCNQDTLTVRNPSSTLYQIYLVYGTYVNVHLSGPKWINVDVVSSLHDQNASSTGLCGQLTGKCSDDFLMRDGSLSDENSGCDISWKNYPNAFINEWKVRENEDLFLFNKDVENALMPWKTYVCVCPEREPGQTVISTDICDTVLECFKGSRVSDRSCAVQTRRKRSVRRHERFPKRIRKDATHFVEKVCFVSSFWRTFEHSKPLHKYD